MISQSHIVISAVVHDLRQCQGIPAGVMTERAEGRTLKDIAAVDDQGVPVLLKAVCAFEQPDVPLTGIAVVRRIDKGMEI